MAFSRMTLVILVVLMLTAAVDGQARRQQDRRIQSAPAADAVGASEAPTGFDNETNGLVVQGDP